MVSPHQRHSNTGEAIARGKAENRPVLNAEDFIDCHHAGKSAGNGHRDDDNGAIDEFDINQDLLIDEESDYRSPGWERFKNKKMLKWKK